MQYSTSFANMYLKPGGVYISLSFWIAMHFNLAFFLDIELLKELHSFEGYKIALLNYGHVLNTREFFFGALKLYFNETNYRHC